MGIPWEKVENSVDSILGDLDYLDGGNGKTRSNYSTTTVRKLRQAQIRIANKLIWLDSTSEFDEEDDDDREGTWHP